MSTLIDNFTLIEQITSLSSLDQIIETILVDDKVGTINVEKVIVESNVVKKINNSLDYILKSNRLIIKSSQDFDKNIIISDLDSETIWSNKKICECISRNTNNIISKELSKLKSVKNIKIKYYKKSFLDKIFNSTSKESILSKIKDICIDNSWIITSKDLFESILIDDTEDLKDGNSLITNRGNLFGCPVYVNPDQKEPKIYFGNYNSLTIIVKKQLSMDELITHSTTYSRGASMEVNYLVIENEPITVLELI